MSFLFSPFLWALSALAIPLAIHLFNLKRYRTYYFSDLRFLQKVEKKTRSIKQLRHWLILALRLLATGALVLAFARPIWGPMGALDEAEKQPHFRIFIDNSLSMSRESVNGSLFNQAIIAAAELIQSLPPNAQVQVLSLDFAPEQYRFYPPETALEILDRLEIGPGFVRWPRLKERLIKSSSELAPEVEQRLYIFSDFQASAWRGIGQAQLPDPWQLRLIQLESLTESPNLAVDSVYFEYPVFSPGFPQKAEIFLRQYGQPSPGPQALKLYLNQDLVAQRIVELPDSGLHRFSLSFSPRQSGHFAGRIEVDAGAPLFDNKLFFAFSTQAQNRVELIDFSSESSFPQKLFSDSLFMLQRQSLKTLDFSALTNAHLVVVEARSQPSEAWLEQLQDFLARGGHLFIFPEEDPAIFAEYARAFGFQASPTWQEAEMRGRLLDYDDPFFRGVFLSREERPSLPGAQRHLRLVHPQLKALVSLENEAPLLARLPYKQGQIFLASTALASRYSNLASHPLLDALLVNAALFRSEASAPYLRTASTGQYLSIPQSEAREQPLAIVDQDQVIIPPQQWQNGQQRVFLPPQELSAGHYPLQSEQKTLALMALNPHRSESNLSSLKETDFKAIQQSASGQWLVLESPDQLSLTGQELRAAKELWPWFVGLALFFGLSELMLTKLWRT